MGCPIRIFADQRLFAPPHNFSQLITSFFASESLGIPHAPFLTSFYCVSSFFCCQLLVTSSFTLSDFISYPRMSKIFYSFFYFYFYSAFLTLTPLPLILLVENKGVEPLTPCVQNRCSGQLS